MDINKYLSLSPQEKLEIISCMSIEDFLKLHEELAQRKVNEESLRKGRPVKIGHLKPLH